MTNEKFLSAEGRIRRSTYLLRIILLNIPIIIIMERMVGTNSDSLALLSLYSIITVICIVLQLMQASKRLHDIDVSGLRSLVLLIPILGLLLHLNLILQDGTAGPNQYGEDPKGRTQELTSQFV